MDGEIHLGLSCLGLVASRKYNYNSSTNLLFFGRNINTSGSLGGNNLYNYNSGSFNTNSNSKAVRPWNFYKLRKYKNILYLR